MIPGCMLVLDASNNTSMYAVGDPTRISIGADKLMCISHLGGQTGGRASRNLPAPAHVTSDRDGEKGGWDGKLNLS